MKYVIFEDTVGQEHVITMDEELAHASVVNPENGRAVAAGFYHIKNGHLRVSPAESESLGLGPRPQDEALLMMAVMKGLSRLDRQNLKMLAMIYGGDFSDEEE